MDKTLLKNPLAALLREYKRKQADLYQASVEVRHLNDGHPLPQQRICVLARELPSGRGAAKPANPRPDTRKFVNAALAQMGLPWISDATWDAFHAASEELSAPHDRRKNGKSARVKKPGRRKQVVTA